MKKLDWKFPDTDGHRRAICALADSSYQLVLAAVDRGLDPKTLLQIKINESNLVLAVIVDGPDCGMVAMLKEPTDWDNQEKTTMVIPFHTKKEAEEYHMNRPIPGGPPTLGPDGEYYVFMPHEGGLYHLVNTPKAIN
jgi:hypothetical protein